jgi:hypothetical protein
MVVQATSLKRLPNDELKTHLEMEPHVFDDGRIVLNVIVLDITETLKE